MKKERLDVILVERGFAESREQAQRFIGAGQVRVAGQVQTKPGHSFAVDAQVDVEALQRFVGRGGEKLEAAFDAFNLEVKGLTCLDVGASTGGFTDCLLQHGAAKVYAVDVGKGQLHWKLRNDPRVVVMEKVNARHLNAESLGEAPSFGVMDVSFISLTKVMPAVINVLLPGSRLVTLIKPQFEAGREQIGHGGVVRDPEVHAAVVEHVKNFGIKELGLEWQDVRQSPLKGPAGNIEFLACWRKPEKTP